ncbi:MAG: hypothetical protein ABJZ55_11010 [Fuerstiella sp.]
MTNSKQDSTNAPISRITLKGITASVFRNVTDKGVPFFKVSITRTFKDGKEFRSTTAFNRDDLPLVGEVVRRAWLEVMRHEADEASSRKGDDS